MRWYYGGVLSPPRPTINKKIHNSHSRRRHQGGHTTRSARVVPGGRTGIGTVRRPGCQRFGFVGWLGKLHKYYHTGIFGLQDPPKNEGFKFWALKNIWVVIIPNKWRLWVLMVISWRGVFTTAISPHRPWMFKKLVEMLVGFVDQDYHVDFWVWYSDMLYV